MWEHLLAAGRALGALLRRLPPPSPPHEEAHPVISLLQTRKRVRDLGPGTLVVSPPSQRDAPSGVAHLPCVFRPRLQRHRAREVRRDLLRGHWTKSASRHIPHFPLHAPHPTHMHQARDPYGQSSLPLDQGLQRTDRVSPIRPPHATPQCPSRKAKDFSVWFVLKGSAQPCLHRTTEDFSVMCTCGEQNNGPEDVHILIPQT